jgi:L-fuconolactonase
VRILDSHLHLWDPGILRYSWLSGRLLRRFGPEDWLQTTAQAAPAERAAVFVQAECLPEDTLAEVDWVARHAAAAGVRGIVARLSMEDGDVGAQLTQLRRRPLVVGVRRLIQDEEPGFATSTSFLSAARAVASAGYVFDACVRPRQMAEVARLADEVPDLPIVLDHLGKPDIDRAPDERWLADLRSLAAHPNVVCKLSGLPAEAPDGWTPARFAPFLDAALDAFGADRLLFGGDWPVSWPYAPWERFVREWVAGATPGRADDILWANAARVYGVE